MHCVEQQFSQGLPLVRAKIVSLEKNGKIVVKAENMDETIPCDFLRTHAGPLPELFTGMLVLCICDGTSGYILGVIQPYLQPQEPIRDRENGQAPSQLDLKAKENISLTCGASTLSMNKNGKIILRGAAITTRAAGANKIKGASVQIN